MRLATNQGVWEPAIVCKESDQQRKEWETHGTSQTQYQTRLETRLLQMTNLFSKSKILSVKFKYLN